MRRTLITLAAAVLASCTAGPDRTITLRGDWRCTDSRTSIVMMPMMIGKITTMRPMPVTRCHQWTKAS